MIKEFKTQNIPVSSNIFKMKAPEFAKLLGFDEVPASGRLNVLAGRIKYHFQLLVNTHTYVFMNLSSARNKYLN